MKLSIGPILIILIGIFLLLSNLDLLPLIRLKAFAATWWPLALILFGLLQLFKKR